MIVVTLLFTFEECKHFGSKDFQRKRTETNSAQMNH